MTERIDLVIVGGGLAGLAAAQRARATGRQVAVVAWTPGSLPHTSGALDLLAVYPTETRRLRERPWEAVSELIEREPRHPYARVGLQGLRDGWIDFLTSLEHSALRYFHRQDRNLAVVTAAGTLKPTFAVPESMRANVLAWEARAPTLVLGIRRLPGFAAEQIVENLRDRWFGLRTGWIDVHTLPGTDNGELMDRQQRVSITGLAAAFEKPTFRERIAEAVRPLLQGARFLGLPPVLGFERVADVCADLEAHLGVPVFEIPMVGPSLPGMRLADLLHNALEADGATILRGQPATSIRPHDNDTLAVTVAGMERTRVLVASQVLLATGRFFGRGLEASQSGVREPLLGLAVRVPRSRDDWHMNTFLGAPGHPINRAGLETDDQLRPVDDQGRPCFSRLHAAGAILSHHDWVREKSGAGISVTTGYAAVERMGQQ